ncbi:MAG: hypothetical protein J5968_03730 [Oscillospiraceae bacterium]|nr:hypothetical protein [Oscillospiraceae bacterium]
MVIYDEKVKERLKSGESTPVERFRAEICEAVAKNLPQVTVFYSAQEQGSQKPAVFARLEKMKIGKKLGGIEEVTIEVALRFLPKRAADDAENELFMTAAAEAAGELGGYAAAFSAERTEKGAKAVITIRFEQKNAEGDTDGVMRVLELNEE